MDESELRLQFFEEADVLFSIYDKDLNCLDVNNATLRTLQLKREDIIGKNIRELSTDAVSSGRYEAYQQVLKTGKTLVIDQLKAKSNHPEIYFRIKAFRVGAGLGIVTKNITDLEMRILQTVQELELKVKNLDEANQKINGMMTVLSNQNVQLNDFCGIISHNLRGPLLNLSMLSDFITECEDREKREIMFNKIKPVVANLTETFDNLIESLQVREEISVECIETSFEEVTKVVLQKHAFEIEHYKALIETNFTDAPLIMYPKKYLDSILSNLISNSLKYYSPTRLPHIQIKTEKKEGAIVLKVIDNGLGINLPKNSQHIFKMRRVFHDHPNAKGFGLFMTKTQVEAMQGEIFVESFPDQGATFTVLFNQKNTI